MKSTTSPMKPGRIPTSESPVSAPSHHKHRTPPRPPKENLNPNHVPLENASFRSGRPLSSSSAKNRNPLPPRPPLNPNSNPLKRKLNLEAVPENGTPLTDFPSDSGVQVILRMRPLSEEESEENLVVQKISSDSVSVLDHTFTFDSVANTKSTQEDIFQLVGRPLVENCLAGFNSSIFAYGQTGSGKTYTMWGALSSLSKDELSSNERGLTPRVFERLFDRIKEEQLKNLNKQLSYQCRCSFLEIYNEQITDLLEPVHGNLQIREDVRTGIYVENLTEALACSTKDVIQLLKKGLENRRMGATSINAESSRSHCVFTCILESRSKCMSDGLSSVRTSRINLVDLAGSERQKQTGAAGERLKEAGNINRSLSQLGNLINILAEVSQSGKQRHIPYRDSRLTFLLQESLGGNAKLAMICAISPSLSCKSESLSTLRFAQRAKAIRNKAVVNEVTQDDVSVLREQIRQLKDELLRMKSNDGSTGQNGSYSTGWNARRSLTILRQSLSHPMVVAAEDDNDEEMEIDDADVEKPFVQSNIDGIASCNESVNHVGIASNDKVLEEVPVSMDVCEVEKISDTDQANKIPFMSVEACQSEKDLEGKLVSSTKMTKDDGITNSSEKTIRGSLKSDANLLNGGMQQEESISLNPDMPCNFPTGSLNIKVNPNLSIVPCQPEAVLELSTSGISPRTENCSRKSLRTSLLMPAREDLKTVKGNISGASSRNNSLIPTEQLAPSSTGVPFQPEAVLELPTSSISPRTENCSRKSLRTSLLMSAPREDLKTLKGNIPGASSRNNSLVPTEQLAKSLHRGLQIFYLHQHKLSLRTSFMFLSKPGELKPPLPVFKVDSGVQTLSLESQSAESSSYICSYCKNKALPLECNDADADAKLQLVPVNDVSHLSENLTMQVPKAVEKVLAGSIRREMALEDLCAKQAAEIAHLNRLVQQYKHERECNLAIEHAREGKICRLEGLMDGIVPADHYMEDEFMSLANEHKILQEKYENHPEVPRIKIELKRVQDELDRYKNFFDLGEKDVLMEEIHDLRCQLQYYVDSPIASWKRGSLLKLTYKSDHSDFDVTANLESVKELCADKKLKEERNRWTEMESKWISLAEDLRVELEATRSLSEKQKLELDSEKKCLTELKEALQTAMEGHACILEQFADLQEKHVQLLARHRKIRDGITDVKKAAARAGVRGAESKFIDVLAAELSALKAEREKERQYWKDENKELQAQLRDTAEAVQAAGELLVRLKESEEEARISQKRIEDAETEVEKCYQEIDGLKKKHEFEISMLNQFLAESRLPKEALPQTTYNDADAANYDTVGTLSDERWRDEFAPFNQVNENDFSRGAEHHSWFTDYDRCNI